MYNETIKSIQVKRVKRSFGEALLDARKQKGLSQQQLADLLFVNRSSIANWEAGRRLPDANMIFQLAKCLDIDVDMLLSVAAGDDERPNVIIVDDSKIILTGGLPVLQAALPNATVTGFTKPSQAVEYAKANTIALAFLDIELGSLSGLDLCHTLLEINPHTNVVFLTAYEEYSMDAWSTGASGFMLKPITVDGVLAQLKNLRHPFPFGGAKA